MSKRKLNSLEDLGGFVYSTREDFNPEEENGKATPEPSEQQLEAHLEKKGRGGKTAVVIKGFEGSEDELKELARKIKNHCAVGGSVKNSEIVIQGNVRDKTMAFLKSEGYKTKRVGG